MQAVPASTTNVEVKPDVTVSDADIKKIDQEIDAQTDARFQKKFEELKSNLTKEFEGMLSANIAKVREEEMQKRAVEVEAIKKQLEEGNKKFDEFSKRVEEFVPDRKAVIPPFQNPYQQPSNDQLKAEFGKSKEEFAQMFGLNLR